MKTVQVAIQDPEYADSMRELLLHDVCRRVHLVATPDVTVRGVIIMDAANWVRLPLLAKERERLIVIVQKDRDDLSTLWDAGVRHVIFQGDSLNTTRGIVLGVELSLG